MFLKPDALPQSLDFPQWRIVRVSSAYAEEGGLGCGGKVRRWKGVMTGGPEVFQKKGVEGICILPDTLWLAS